MFDWKVARRLLKYMWHYKWLYLIGLVAVVVVDMIQLLIPEITGLITDGLEAKTITSQGIWRQVIYLLLIGLCISVLRFVWRYFIFGTSRRIERRLREDYFNKLTNLSVDFYTHQKTGDLMAYATNDLNAIRMMVGPGFLMGLDAIILTALVIYKMVKTIDVGLTLFSIMPLPIIALGSLFLGGLIRKRFMYKQEAFAHLSDLVQENISGIRVIKAFVKESYEMTKFSLANRKNYDANMKVVRLFAFMMPMVGLISGLSVAIALFLGGQMAMTGLISLGDFVAFVQYLLMLVWPMMAFGWCINIMSQGSASLGRFEEIMAAPIDIKDQVETKSLVEVRGEIKIHNLNFSYEEAPILRDLNLTIKAGETLGILGKTGSGKTTLCNLLLRLYNPPAETIFIDGQDILNLKVETLRNLYAYVPQDNFLFSDTLTKNIGFAYNSPEEAQVIEAAKLANVHDNIIEFKEGYDTVVGERGVTLSGGQKQRVSIARALMKNAPIMILDDAVSAVDTKTEEAILGALKETRKHQTTLLIAHRISTLSQADHIIVLEDGRITEDGTHESLMAAEGYYYQMFMKQQLEKAIVLEV